MTIMVAITSTRDIFCNIPTSLPTVFNVQGHAANVQNENHV